MIIISLLLNLCRIDWQTNAICLIISSTDLFVVVRVYLIDAITQMRKQRHRTLRTRSLRGMLAPKSLCIPENMDPWGLVLLTHVSSRAQIKTQVFWTQCPAWWATGLFYHYILCFTMGPKLIHKFYLQPALHHYRNRLRLISYIFLTVIISSGREANVMSALLTVQDLHLKSACVQETEILSACVRYLQVFFFFFPPEWLYLSDRCLSLKEVVGT